MLGLRNKNPAKSLSNNFYFKFVTCNFFAASLFYVLEVWRNSSDISYDAAEPELLPRNIDADWFGYVGILASTSLNLYLLIEHDNKSIEEQDKDLIVHSEPDRDRFFNAAGSEHIIDMPQLRRRSAI